MIRTKLVGMWTFLAVASCGAMELEQMPLWGSDWIIAQGVNERIYPSALPLVPNVVVYASFKNKYGGDLRVEVRWANCQHREFRSTAEVVDYILNEFRDNVESHAS